jgi:hypothetical protein
LSQQFTLEPTNVEKMQELQSALRIVREMPFSVNLWSAQNHVYAIQSGLYQRIRRKAQRGDASAQLWMENYTVLSDLLSIRLQ